MPALLPLPTAATHTAAAGPPLPPQLPLCSRPTPKSDRLDANAFALRPLLPQLIDAATVALLPSHRRFLAAADIAAIRQFTVPFAAAASTDAINVSLGPVKQPLPIHRRPLL